MMIKKLYQIKNLLKKNLIYFKLNLFFVTLIDNTKLPLK